MRYFHIGVRADEIVEIGPSNDSKFPTQYRLRNGAGVNSTGEWRDNVAKVESILNDQRETLDAFNQRKKWLETEITALTFRAENLRSIIELRTKQLTPERQDFLTLIDWLASHRNYMKVEERAALARALGEVTE